MRFWTILLSTVFVCSAALVGVMWRGKTAEPPPPPTVPERAATEQQIAGAPIRSVSPAAQVSAAAPDAANGDHWPPPAARLSAAAQDTADVDAAPPHASGASTPVEAALPVQIGFHHISNIIEATIVNVSKEELTVDVSVRPSGSLRTLDLAPGIPTSLGVRDGLEFHAADQVTVRGGAYRELVTTVR